MDADVTERSYAPITSAHLARLAAIADDDHARFTRPDGQPEYRHRRIGVVLAQGAAQHHLDGTTGVKDIDVWSFYSTVPGRQFSFGRRILHVDFGPSEHGRNRYPEGFEHPQLPRWQRFRGRRVDLMIRGLPVPPEAPFDDVAAALRGWLAAGSRMRRRSEAQKMPTNWWLARKAVVVIDPAPDRGRILWPEHA